MMQLQTISASVTDSGDPVRVAAAKDFLSYIVSSEEARVWHQELMGNPTSITTLEASDNMPKLAVDVVNVMKEGRGAESMFEWMPVNMHPDLEQAWAMFVAGEYDRDQFTERYEQIFQGLRCGPVRLSRSRNLNDAAWRGGYGGPGRILRKERHI